MPQQAIFEWRSLRGWYCHEFPYASGRKGTERLAATMLGPYKVQGLVAGEPPELTPLLPVVPLTAGVRPPRRGSQVETEACS